MKLALFQIKSFVSKGAVRFIDTREKNIQTLLALKMTIKDVYDELLNLDVRNYCGGPADDRNSEDQKCIWEFGKMVREREVYIKIKLTESMMIDISFHFSERPLYYHYGNDK